MSKIMDRLEKTMAAMQNAGTSTALGLKLKKAAIAAMMGGRGSDEWKSYMSLFAANEEQLARLTAPITAADPSWLPESRAYMIANAICGGDSTTQTGVKVEMDIDDNISDVPDGNIVEPGQPKPANGVERPFVIP
jgi:hypothetical protein